MKEEKSDNSGEEVKLKEDEGSPYAFLEGGSSPMDRVDQLLELPLDPVETSNDKASQGLNKESSESNEAKVLLANRNLEALEPIDNSSSSQMEDRLTIDVTAARNGSENGASRVEHSTEDIDASRERADSIPKFKVKSDIFAHKSPPLSPDPGEVSSDDKV